MTTAASESKSERLPMDRILVPVDFSTASQAGLDYAIELAKRFDAELILLFVVEPLYYAGDLGLLIEEQRRLAHEEMTTRAQRLSKLGIRYNTQVRTGTPYQIIAEEAERQKANLIVMATHGRTGLSHMLLGSVTEKVVRTATCPVLTVRPD